MTHICLSAVGYSACSEQALGVLRWKLVFYILIEKCKLIGRLIGEKVANFTGVKNFTNHAWGYPRNLVVTELGPNLFQFQFEIDDEREKVLMGGPWVLDNQVLVIKNWEMGCERKPQFFRYTYLWVQVWNLPVH